MNDIRPITITHDLYSNLDDERKELFTASGTVYTLDLLSISDANLLLKDEGYAWNAERSSERMARTQDDLPLDDINSSVAQVRIDFDLLGPKNMKTCSAASVFVDIDCNNRWVVRRRRRPRQGFTVAAFVSIRDASRHCGQRCSCRPASR